MSTEQEAGGVMPPAGGEHMAPASEGPEGRLGLALAVLGTLGAGLAAALAAPATVAAACLGPVLLGGVLALRAEQRSAADAQREVLRAMARRGRGLPAATDALVEGARTLAELGGRLDAVQGEQAATLGAFRAAEEAARSARGRFEESIAGALREAVADGVDRAGRVASADAAAALDDALGPRLQAALDALGDGLGSHLSLLRDGARKEAEAREALRAELAAAQRAEVERLLERLEALEGARRAAHADLCERLETDASVRRDEAEVREARLATIWEDAAGGFTGGLSAAVQRDEDRASAFAAGLEAAQARLEATADAVLTRLDAQAAALATRAQEEETQLRDALLALETGAAALSAGSEREREGLDAYAARLVQVAETALAEGAAERLEALGTRLEAVASAVEETAVLVRGGGTELAAAAELFAASATGHAEAARVWVESLGTVEGALLDAGERAAADALGDTLARTHDLFDQQLAFHEALLAQVGGASSARRAVLEAGAEATLVEREAVAMDEDERTPPAESAAGLIDAPDLLDAPEAADTEDTTAGDVEAAEAASA